MTEFVARINEAIEKNQRRGRAIFLDSIQRTVRDAQRVHREGGRMRVKTGFLRASIQAALTPDIRGPGRGNREYGPNEQVAGMTLAVALLRWKPGNDVYVGWTANYARYREHHDGFMRLAAGKWEEYVRRATRASERM